MLSPQAGGFKAATERLAHASVGVGPGIARGSQYRMPGRFAGQVSTFDHCLKVLGDLQVKLGHLLVAVALAAILGFDREANMLCFS